LGKAQKFAEENQDQVYEIFANTSDTFTADTYKEYYSFDTSFSFWNPELNDDVIASIQNTADYMAENGYIANKINISDFVKEYYKVQN
jgi:ABC-type nitrate/sulfonate/bicarbonate transport system substrate-binding protein